ncbi:MAG: hypothetical protein IPQ04_15470 [Saprospiraceae bacterium]|nr:hypothetical protein [Saprospiraceae bacterium]
MNDLNQECKYISYYVNTNYQYRDALEELNSDRFLLFKDSSLTQAKNQQEIRRINIILAGINFVYTPKLEFGYDGRFRIQLMRLITNNTSNIAGITSGILASQNENHTSNNNKFK